MLEQRAPETGLLQLEVPARERQAQRKALAREAQRKALAKEAPEMPRKEALETPEKEAPEPGPPGSPRLHQAVR